jgi:beta-lactam-binding protein with PASTA domain
MIEQIPKDRHMCFFTRIRNIFSATVLSAFIISGLTACTGATGETESVPSVNVPDMVGFKQSVALTAISDNGLVKGSITSRPDNTVGMDNVISQSPASGALVVEGTTVNLVVSTGQAVTTVPNVVGQTQGTAETLIVNNGLFRGTITTSASNTFNAGLIISQSPSAGTTVNPNTGVNIEISLGSASISVPNVVGMTQSLAQSSITGSNLAVGNTVMVTDNSIPSGDVISQIPASGTMVATNTPINLVVSSGPPTASVTVPNAVGQTEAAAVSMVTSAGLVANVTKVYNGTVAAGIVISLAPSTGASVAAGSTVTIVVSLGPPPTGSGNPFSFIVFGDFNGGGCARNTRVASIVSSMNQEANIDFFISTGDIIDGYGQGDNSTTCFASNPSSNSSFTKTCSPEGNMAQILAPLKNRTPPTGLNATFFPVIGNHDDNFGSNWYPDPCGDGICDFLAPNTPDTFINHSHGDICSKNANTSAHSSDFYYSFTYQNNYFIILRINGDSNTLLSACNGNPGHANCVSYCSDQSLLNDATRNSLCWGDNGQYKWYLDELQKAKAYDNTFVFSHAVAFGGGDGHLPFEGSAQIRAAAEAAGVDIYFNGHNHAYQRSHAVKGSTIDSTGTTYITSGVAGATTNEPYNDSFTAASVNDWVTPGMSNQLDRKASYIKISVNGQQVSGEVYSPFTQSTPVDTFNNGVTTPPPPPPPSSSTAPVIAGCQLFPDDNLWNTAIDTLPVHANSANFINSIGPSIGLHPDFGTTYLGSNLGIPFDIVDSTTPLVPINFTPNGSGDESDLGNQSACNTGTDTYVGCYPIPTNPSIEGGSVNSGLGVDSHMIFLNKDSCTLYEVYLTTGQAGSWGGESGAIWDLGKNEVRPYNITSADAAGLAILPGLVRYDEVFGPDEINHALRITMQDLQAGFIWPATHSDGTAGNDANKPPMGLRLRLKSSFNISSSYPAFIQKIMRALKKYGVIIADTGGQMYLSGDHDMNWDDTLLKTLENNITASDFEVVDTNPPTPLEVYPYPCSGSNCPTSWPLLY